MTTLLPIRTPEQLAAVTRAAEADGHVALCPSHAVQDDAGRIVGYVSLARVPVLHFWAHTQGGVRQTLGQWQNAMAIAAERGLSQVVVPCTDDSPLKPYLERMGATPIGQVTLYLQPVPSLQAAGPAVEPRGQYKELSDKDWKEAVEHAEVWCQAKDPYERDRQVYCYRAGYLKAMAALRKATGKM